MFRLVPGGYLVELRLPRSLVGPRLGFSIVDVNDVTPGAPVNVISTSDLSGKQTLGAVIVPSPEVSELVSRLGRARSRIWVLDVNHRVIAQAGSLRAPPVQPDPDQDAITRFWEAGADLLVRPILKLAMSEPNEDFQDIAPGTYRLEGREIDDALAGQTGTRRRLTPDSRAVVLSAAQPVYLEDKVVGAVLVEETTNDVLALRNRAFEKLFAALVVVYTIGTIGLLVFATRLSLRIRRLRDEAASGFGPKVVHRHAQYWLVTYASNVATPTAALDSCPAIVPSDPRPPDPPLPHSRSPPGASARRASRRLSR